MGARVIIARVLLAGAVLLPCGSSESTSPSVHAQVDQDPDRWRPSPVHVARPLEPVTSRLLAYNPHRPLSHVVRGSGHTHAAPDHSGIDVAVQERRLRDLAAPHRHDFAWITAHDVVVDDPGVDGITHLFGVEVYADRTEALDVHAHFVGLLPDGRLAGSPPFGIRAHAPAELVRRIHEARGLAVLAHPSRYALPLEIVAALPSELWGIEVPSGRTDPTENEPWLDARLSAGRYACVGAGGDIHDEDYTLTSGYQLVSVSSERPSRAQLWEAVRSCNFFACGVHSARYPLIEDPRVEIREGAIRFETRAVVTSIEAIGRGGRVLASESDTTSLVYTPSAGDQYVRFRARRAQGHAICLSQPVWLVPR